MPAGDALPLAGKRVLVTRPAGQASELAWALEALGAAVTCIPAIEVRPRPDDVARAAADWASADWAVFTSANAARFLLPALEAACAPARSCARRPVVAAIGPATAEVLEAAGLPVDLVPEVHQAEGLLAALLARGVEGRRVLLPVAAKARDVLPEGLRAAGAHLLHHPIYETVFASDGAAQLRELLDARAIDVVTFTSSSTVDAFRELACSALPEGLVFAAIGPVTAATVRSHGLAPLVVAGTSTVPGLLDALVAHYQRGT